MTIKEMLEKINFQKMQGIVPVVTQDVKTKRILTLAFMNRESLEKTLELGKVTYWSRTRKRLWTKGETSRNYQLVKEIFIDCDDDSLLIKVKQLGNVCHTGRPTCFFKKVSLKKQTKKTYGKSKYVKIRGAWRQIARAGF